jgi:hypothetical protein
MHKVSSVLYTTDPAVSPSCILLRSHVILNLVIKVTEVTRETGQVTFTLVSEIPQLLTRTCEISRQTKSINLRINRVVVI